MVQTSAAVESGSRNALPVVPSQNRTLPSALPVTSVLPSGLKVRLLSAPAPASVVLSNRPVLTSQKRMRPSPQAVARVFPPGWKAAVRLSGCFSGGTSCRPVATSHRQTVRLEPLVRRVLPSGLKTTDQISTSCICSSQTGLPVAVSQSRALPDPPDARRTPSGLYATLITLAGCWRTV